MKKITKLNLAKELSNYNYTTNLSRIFNIDEFIGEYECLKFGNGGSWCRRSNLKNHKVATMKNNGKILFLWNNVTDIEKQEISNEFHTKCKIEDYGNYIRYIKFCGLTNFYINRPIRQDIKNYYKKLPCCACGRKTNLVCDHKNDLYNDLRVLDTKTQIISDFQSLCNQCNLQKRQVNKKTKETGKRYGATNIPMLKIFGIDFIDTNEESFDIDDIDALKCTYWYDPCKFMKYIQQQQEISTYTRICNEFHKKCKIKED